MISKLDPTRWLTGSCTAALLAIAGCITEPQADPRMTGKPADIGELRECLVCKRNGDLACVSTLVRADTSHLVHNGGTYYFCSDGCKEDFEKEPARFLKSNSDRQRR